LYRLWGQFEGFSDAAEGGSGCGGAAGTPRAEGPIEPLFPTRIAASSLLGSG